MQSPVREPPSGSRSRDRAPFRTSQAVVLTGSVHAGNARDVLLAVDAGSEGGIEVVVIHWSVLAVLVGLRLYITWRRRARVCAKLAEIFSPPRLEAFIAVTARNAEPFWKAGRAAIILFSYELAVGMACWWDTSFGLKLGGVPGSANGRYLPSRCPAIAVSACVLPASWREFLDMSAVEPNAFRTFFYLFSVPKFRSRSA